MLQLRLSVCLRLCQEGKGAPPQSGKDGCAAEAGPSLHDRRLPCRCCKSQLFLGILMIMITTLSIFLVTIILSMLVIVLNCVENPEAVPGVAISCVQTCGGNLEIHGKVDRK